MATADIAQTDDATQLTLGSTPVRVLVADPIAEDGVERLRAAGRVDVRTGLAADELVSVIGDYDALVVRSETKVTARVLDAAGRLRVVGRAGVGVDNIDLDAATRHGVLVLNAPAGNTIAAAEQAITLMLASARRIAPADASLRAGRWERKSFMGVELRDKTLGLLGLGKIGFEVARIASQGLQMRVIAHDPLVAAERAASAGAELVGLETLVSEADVLSVHVPLNDETRGCIGAPELAAMRRGAIVINVARGGIIDEPALAEAVVSGHLGGAAVDVFTSEPPAPGHPLLQDPRILVTPHLGASTQEAQVNVAFDVADQIVAVLAGGAARYGVNAPSIPPEELAELQPYTDVAERMGSLAAQLGGGRLRRVVCSYHGDLAERDTVVLTAAALRGLFSGRTETRINQINAREFAKQHGLDLRERRISDPLDEITTTAMLLQVVGGETVSLAGTQLGGTPRIIRINDFHVDMRPEGTFLLGTHDDRPGVIRDISGILATNDINIASVELGRDYPRGHAVMVMQIDDPVPAAILEELRHAAGMRSLREVRL